MITKEQDNKKWTSPRDRALEGREIVDRLSRRGIIFSLDEDGGLEAQGVAVDEAGEYVPINEEILTEISVGKELILGEVRKREDSAERMISILVEHNPEWREEFGADEEAGTA